MPQPRTLLLLFILLLSCTWLFSSGLWKSRPGKSRDRSHSSRELKSAISEKMRVKASAAKIFATQNNYNETACFLVDMSLSSGKNRFFIYDLVKDSIRSTGLVTHGRCNEDWLEGRRYGNTVGCGCTSLGKYKIGNSYYGRFGLAFKLYGLDKTNDKAFSRFVVLHSHECVPETEIKDDICQSDGCPTVSPNFLQQLKTIITNSGKPVLLWIFE
jgi:hypothetical protein